MKSLFFIFLGAIPLAALTLLSFGDIVLVRGWRPELKAEHFAKPLSMARQIDEQLLTIGSAPEKLATDNLLTVPMPDSMRGMREDIPLWGSTPGRVQKWSTLMTRTVEFLEAQRFWDSGELEQLFKLQTKITEFKNSLSDEKEPQKKAKRQLEILGRNLDDNIDKLQKNKIVTQLLADARNAFEAGKWQAAASFCKEIQTDYGQYITPQVSADTTMMINQSVFNANEEGITLVLESSDKENQREKLLDFLGKVEDPDKLSQQQLEKYNQWKARLTELGGEDSAGQTAGQTSGNTAGSTIADKVASSGIDSLDPDSQALVKPYFDLPNSFTTRIVKAAEILRKSDTPVIRSLLKADIMKIIRQGIPEKVYVPTSGADDASSGADSSEQKKLISRYNKAREHVLVNVTNRDTWAKFIAFCNTMQIKEETSSGSEDFKRPANVSRTISDPDRWPDVVFVLK